jgi:hypothetical protein
LGCASTLIDIKYVLGATKFSYGRRKEPVNEACVANLLYLPNHGVQTATLWDFGDYPNHLLFAPKPLKELDLDKLISYRW